MHFLPLGLMYSKNIRDLTRVGDNGAPKPWRYRPGPMNNIEKFIFLVPTILVVFIMFPLGTFGYGLWFLVIHYAVYGLIPLFIVAGRKMRFLICIAVLTAHFEHKLVLPLLFPRQHHYQQHCMLEQLVWYLSRLFQQQHNLQQLLQQDKKR